MNEQERNFVTKNLPILIQYTTCNAVLLAKLRAENILSPVECQELEVRGRNNGEISQAYLLYDKLFTKTNSYDKLLNALKSPDQNQSGAVKILEYGKKNGFTVDKSYTEDSQVFPKIYKFIVPPTRLRDVFNNEKVPIVVISTEDIAITTRRLQAEPISLTFSVFSTQDTLEREFSKLSQGQTMLLAMYGQKLRALKDALQVLKNLTASDKQCIVVTTETDAAITPFVGDINSGHSKICDSLVDDIKWSHLSREFQSELLETKVLFQGRELPFKELLSLFGYTQQQNELLNRLETKIIMQLINKENPVFCNNTLEGRHKTHFYIQRKLIPRKAVISKEILKQGNSPSNTVFAIGGMQRHQLTLLKAGLVKSHEEQIRSRESETFAKFVLLKTQKEFASLCNSIASASLQLNLHWLNNTGSGLEWVCSYGKPDGICLIQKYIVLENREAFATSEQSFLDKICQNLENSSTPAVCISDNPGMGKSTLMVHISQKFLSTHALQKTFVQYFVMSDIMKDLEEIGVRDEKNLSRQHILQVILKRITGTDVICHIFQQPGTHCEIFLDGFDEVLPHQAKLATKFVSMLRYEFKKETGPTFRLWLTTRPVLLEQVEQTLGVLGYNMLPFDETDQEQFLQAYWTHEASKRGIKLKPERLVSFTRGCIQRMSKVNGKLSQFEVDMTGIPLQCLLLAQVCEGAVNLECCVEGRPEDGALNLEVVNPEDLKIKNMADLYNRAMDKKLEIFLNRESSNSHLQSHLSKNNKQVMKRIHMKLALEILFPEWLSKFEILFLHEANISAEELSIYGFVTEFYQNKPVFVHRTYAEYFVALFAVEFGLCQRFLEGFGITDAMATFYLDGLLATKPEERESKWFTDLHLAVFQMPVVTYFIDELLELNKVDQDLVPTCLKRAIRTNFQETQNGVELNLETSKILGCVTNDRPNIAKLLISSLNDISVQNWLQNSAKHHATLVFAAALKGSKESLEILCNLLAKWNSKSDFSRQAKSDLSSELARNPILAAVLVGNLESVEYLVMEKEFKPEVWALPEYKVLHHCVSSTSRLSPRSIEKRKEIINFLVAAQNHETTERYNILEHFDFLDRTPLLAEDVHIELRMTLVDAGADIQACFEGGNVFHMLGDFCGVTSEIYEKFVEKIHIKFQEILKNVQDDNEYPISIFTCKGGSVRGATFTPNWHWADDTPLHLAIGHLEVTDKTLEIFENYGFNWNDGNDDGFTVLHIAVKFGRSLEFIKKLIECYKADLDFQNHTGRTALHEAALVGRADFLTWLLEEYEVDVNSYDYQENTALHHAMIGPEEMRFEVVQILLENESDGNAVNFEGDTPLTHSLSQGRAISVEFLQYLKNKDVNILGIGENDKAGVIQALYAGANLELTKSKDLESIVNYLVDEGVVDLVGIEGKQNLVHLAAAQGWIGGLKLLEKHLPIETIKDMVRRADAKGYTPIYKAMELGKNLDVLKWFVAQGGESILNEICGPNGILPIHVCGMSGWLEGLKILVDKYDINVTARDHEKNTVLHYAYNAEGSAMEVKSYLKARIGENWKSFKNTLDENPEDYVERKVEEARKEMEQFW